MVARRDGGSARIWVPLHRVVAMSGLTGEIREG